ncbi:MAG: aconitate hydratase [Armatimonadetes bacterium]|nr:aconitate hydratase [Armatimonadota bacterium]
MKGTVVEKILSRHLVSGELTPGAEISIRIAQTLTQDATGTMAYLQFEAMGVPRVKTELSVSYVDHNMLQTGFENADDHLYLRTVAAKHGVYFSRPGNGICHQVHLERFGVPGKTLLGSDSHTPTAGGIGMIGIGAGGLDVACAMAGEPFSLTCPKVVRVELNGALSPWVSAKDVILELLRRLSVKGGVGRIFEYGGPGVGTLSVPERATITNMGAELGATSSVFPSDELTRDFLIAQERGDAWEEFVADADAEYDEIVEIDLSALEPMIARPHSPDNVVAVREVAGTPVDQVCIGSCTNSSLRDMLTVAAALRGKTLPPEVSLAISPGSRQVLEMMARNGALADIIGAGARILESACGPCIGMGLSPMTDSVSVRSFNRNFEGRSGTLSAQVFLASPETCVAAALTGKITDPRELGDAPVVSVPERFDIDDRMIVAPPDDGSDVEVIRGPNIQFVDPRGPIEDTIRCKVLLRLGDNVTTDDIAPAGAKVLPYRSNIPKMAEFAFANVAPDFAEKAREAGAGVILGGDNYGQGSSREHAALVPMYLGVRAVLARSFARIHKANLVNFGIVPMVIDEETYGALSEGDEIELSGVVTGLSSGTVQGRNLATGAEFTARVELTSREIEVLRAGGMLTYVKSRAAGG